MVSVSHAVVFIFAEKDDVSGKNWALQFRKNRWFNTTQILCNHFVLDFFFLLSLIRWGKKEIFRRNAIRFYDRSGCVITWPALCELHLLTIFLANYITTSIYILGIKMIIQFFMNENVYIRILCHNHKIFFTLSLFI